MSSVLFSPASEDDLREIHDYIAADNVVAGERLLVEMQQSCEKLVRHPRLGVGRDDLMPGLRLIAVRQMYVVFYRVKDDNIEIIIRHVFQVIEAICCYGAVICRRYIEQYIFISHGHCIPRADRRSPCFQAGRNALRYSCYCLWRNEK